MDQDLTSTRNQILLAKAGDREALDQVLSRYQDRLLRIVRQRLGNRLRSMLESGDIVQSTMLSAVESLDRFEMRDERSLINWLAKLAERQITGQADYWGTAKRELDRMQQMDAVGESPDAAQPLDRAIAEEHKEIVSVLMMELRKEHRELILLRLYAGKTWKAIAAETGRASEDAARVMYAVAVRELTRLLRRRLREDKAT